MRTIALCGLASGCGAAVYFPQEPGPRDTSVAAADTGGSTADTGEAPTVPTVPTVPTEPTIPTGIDGLPCSAYGAFYATLEVRNARAAPIDLLWRDFQCAEWFYARIEPGATLTQGTYDRHAWVVRDAVSAPLGSWVVDEIYERWEVP